MTRDRRRPGARTSVRPWVAGGIVVLLAGGIADWLLLRSGRISHPPAVLAALVAALVLLLAVLAVTTAVELLRRRRRAGAGAGQLLLVSGLLALLLGGLFNWLLGLQGYVILLEGEGVPLHGGSHLQEFEAGPLARVEELHLTLRLIEVELLEDDAGRVRPRSRLAAQHGLGDPVALVVSPDAGAVFAAVLFHQGAFGFAPRIVILEEGETVFDRVVPFITRRRGPEGITFEGLFTLESERLEVEGAVDLASLDEGLRGHATLHLAVRREDELLGRGSLRPGHFAEVEDGYRVGFAGLEKWSEIDVSRRSYGGVVLAGAGVALLGGVLWPVARWRGF